MPSEITPKFNGKASCFAQFLVEFVGYALLHVKGVDGLHALDDEDSKFWKTARGRGLTCTYRGA